MTEKKDYADINLELIKQYKHGSSQAKEELIKCNMRLVNSIAIRFADRGTDIEDLIQIGILGLLKAIEGFDDEKGYSFSTYAFPFISGEIKRFLRDDGQIKISRITKRNSHIVLKEKENFQKSFGREPKISELAERCSLSDESIIEALNAAIPPLSLQDKVCSDDGDYTIEDLIKDEDKISEVTDIIALKQAIDELCEFDKSIITLRFFKNITQSATAKILGISQVTVSRSEKKIIDKLRQKIL